MEDGKEFIDGDEYGKILESNLGAHLTNFLKTFFIHHETASVTGLVSFKLNDQSKDYFVKINMSSPRNKSTKHENQNPLRILTSNNSYQSEVASESSIKENSKPLSDTTKLSLCELENKEIDLCENNKTQNHKNNFENDFKNIFLSTNNSNNNNNNNINNNNCDLKIIPKSDRRKSKRPQRNIIESTNDSTEFTAKSKIQKLTFPNINPNKISVKLEETENQELINEDNKEKLDKDTSNSIIISNDHKILPSILALNGISGDNSILTSALMSPSNGLTILSQNAYNILRSVGSLTVAAQSNSIPFLNTCVSLSNNTTQSNVITKNKGLVISSSNIAAISINQPISQTPNLSVISSDSNITTTTSTQNALRAISTITTSRQSVPSQVVQAHSSKLYKCRYCCKTFNRKFCRERHERLHTGIKPYTCEICNDKFIRLEDKKRHVRSTHSGRDSSTELTNGGYLSRSNSPETPSTKI